MIALIYETLTTGPRAGTQIVAGRIRLIEGRLIGEPPDDPSVQFVLGRALHQDDGTILTATDDPRAFLLALPAAYSGSMIRVGLEA
jgi:hypothetical protein